MADYASMSYQQLHDLVMGTDPAAVRAAADHWGTVSQSLTGLSNQLTANRLSLLESQGWSGKAAQAFYTYMDSLLREVDQVGQGATQAHTALSTLADHISTARTAMGNVPPPATPNTLEQHSVLFSEYGVTPSQVETENARRAALAIVTKLAGGYDDAALVLDATHAELPPTGPARPAVTAPSVAPETGKVGPGRTSRLSDTTLAPARATAGAPVGPGGRPLVRDRAGVPLVDLAQDGAAPGPLQPGRDKPGSVAEEGIDALLVPATATAEPPGEAAGSAVGLAPGTSSSTRTDGVAGGIATLPPARDQSAPAVSGGRHQRSAPAETGQEENGQPSHPDGSGPTEHHHGVSGGMPSNPPANPQPAPGAGPGAPVRMPATAPTAPTPPTPGGSMPGGSLPGGAVPGGAAAITGPQAQLPDGGGTAPLFGPGAVGGARAPMGQTAPMTPVAPMTPMDNGSGSRRSWFRVRGRRVSAQGARSSGRSAFALSAEEAGNPPVID
jgi:uncharacterized protein YukE